MCNLKSDQIGLAFKFDWHIIPNYGYYVFFILNHQLYNRVYDGNDKSPV